MFHVIDNILASHIVLDIRHYPGSTLVDEYRNGGGGGGGHHDWYCLPCKTVLLAWAKSVVGQPVGWLDRKKKKKAGQGKAMQIRSDQIGREREDFSSFVFLWLAEGFERGRD